MAESYPLFADAEEWRPVKGFEGRYEVSSRGNVRSLLTDRILSPGPTSRGYLSVQLYDGSAPKKSKSSLVHQLVASAFLGPKAAGQCVNHMNGSKQDNRAENLEYVTPQENTAHAEGNGFAPRRHYGSKHRNAKLNENDVHQVKIMLSVGMTAGAIGRAFNVSTKLICDIRDGKAWKHVRDVEVEVKEV